jgi:hypothetical protein
MISNITNMILIEQVYIYTLYTHAILLSQCDDDAAFDDLDSCLYKSIRAKDAFSRWTNEALETELLMQSYIIIYKYVHNVCIHTLQYIHYNNNRKIYNYRNE